MFGMLLSFQYVKKLLTESHPNIACIARNKEQIGNLKFEAPRCTGIHRGVATESGLGEGIGGRFISGPFWYPKCK